MSTIVYFSNFVCFFVKMNFRYLRSNAMSSRIGICKTSYHNYLIFFLSMHLCTFGIRISNKFLAAKSWRKEKPKLQSFPCLPDLFPLREGPQDKHKDKFILKTKTNINRDINNVRKQILRITSANSFFFITME